MQGIIFLTIFRREMNRIFRIWTQTLIPPILNQSLYFVIFGGVVGTSLAITGNVSYAAFLAPGLIAMGVITNSYSNVSTSFFGAKFQKSIEEFLVSPVRPSTLFLGYISGGIVRGAIIALITWGISLFFGGYSLEHPLLVLSTLFLLSYFFSTLGFLNSLFAKTFDHVSLIPTFFLTPLSYLGGIFYPIALLPEWAQTLSYFNPIAWVITLLRYGFLGVADRGLAFIAASFLGLFVVSLMASGLALYLLKQGKGIRS